MDAATRAAVEAAQAEMAAMGGSPQVRAADQQLQDHALYDAQEQAAIMHMQRKAAAKTTINDPFRTFNGGASKGGLGDMFKTPDDMMFKGTFEEAASEAERSSKCES
eukprot:COSAG01_NODE_5065_length_4517_cov_11.071978_2_plen_107_part_00